MFLLLLGRYVSAPSREKNLASSYKKLRKFGWNISTNNMRMKNHTASLFVYKWCQILFDSMKVKTSNWIQFNSVLTEFGRRSRRPCEQPVFLLQLRQEAEKNPQQN